MPKFFFFHNTKSSIDYYIKSEGDGGLYITAQLFSVKSTKGF